MDKETVEAERKERKTMHRSGGMEKGWNGCR